MKVPPYKYYLIDLDRTLWDFDKNSKSAICKLIRKREVLHNVIREFESNTSEREPLDIFFEKYDIINHKLWKEYEEGSLTKENLRWRRFHDAFLLYGYDNETHAREFGEEYLEQMICETELMPGAMELLKKIESQGGRMAIISNGFKEVQYRKLNGSGISHFFEAVIVSEEVGAHKPSPKIFEEALKRITGIVPQDDPVKWKAAKKETLMIGDDYTNDIEGAMIFGIDQFFYNHKKRGDCPGATYESSDLSPLI